MSHVTRSPADQLHPGVQDEVRLVRMNKQSHAGFLPLICVSELISRQLENSSPHDRKHLVILQSPTQPHQPPLNEQSEMTGEHKYIISNGSD